MSIHLIGGGRTASWRSTLYGPFVTEAVRHRSLRSDHPAGAPRIAVVVVVDDPATEGESAVGWFAEALGTPVVEVVPYVLAVGAALPAGALSGLDGLLIGGGLTPAYHRALSPRTAEIATLVAGGAPYLGFSAGAMIASDRALIGGWRLEDRVVCTEDNAEDLDQLTVQNGLGLVPFGVDVHLAQWGNLSRLVAATGAGLLAGTSTGVGVGIDEDTAVIWDGSGPRVLGAGRAWWCERTERGVEVRTLGVERS